MFHQKRGSDIHTSYSYITTKPSTGIESGLMEQNKLLKLQTQSLRQQLNSVKKQMLSIYQENLELKEKLGKSKQYLFMKECQEEIQRLKSLVQELSEQKRICSSERQQIKDRIIMKLEDQVITLKILLKQSKYTATSAQ